MHSLLKLGIEQPTGKHVFSPKVKLMSISLVSPYPDWENQTQLGKGHHSTPEHVFTKCNSCFPAAVPPANTHVHGGLRDIGFKCGHNGTHFQTLLEGAQSAAHTQKSDRNREVQVQTLPTPSSPPQPGQSQHEVASTVELSASER